MAITREKIDAAVEQYLPRTINYAQSADLGEKDVVGIFNRLFQAVLTSLLLDDESVFYLVYLCSQRLKASLDNAISILEDIQSTDLLRAVSEIPPTGISDLSDLRAARRHLLQLSGSVAKGQFGETYFNNFRESVKAFLTDQVKPDVENRNQVSVSQDIRSQMEALVDAWADVLARRETVFAIVESFSDEDLRATACTTIINAVDSKLSTIEDELASYTTEEQAAAAEQIMIDMAAAQAALKIISSAPDPMGETILGPADSARTERTYLSYIGKARTEPFTFVLRGTAGRPYIDKLVASKFGRAVDDGDGDLSTPTWQDTSVNFITSGVEVGHHLVIYKTGRLYEITAVDVNELQLNPELIISTEDIWYIVMESAPGTIFRDDDQEFWDEYSGGETESQVVAAGALGYFTQKNKVTGTDGTNIKASGTTGETRPEYADGVLGAAIALDEWEDSAAAFLSDGIVAGTHVLYCSGPTNFGIYSIVSVDTEHQITVSGTLTWPTTGESWTMWLSAGFSNPANPYSKHFRDLSGTLLTSGVDAGDWLEISAFPGTLYEVGSVLDEQDLLITTQSFLTNSAQTYTLHNTRIFKSAGATFQSSGVVAGDFIHISAAGIDDVYTVESVDSEHQITLVETISSSFSGATFEIYSTDSETDLFREDDGVDLEAAGVGGLLAGILTNGSDYTILYLDFQNPTSSLLIDTTVGVVGPFSWAILASETTNVFRDTVNAPFGSYVAGDYLVIPDLDVRLPIDEIVSDEEVILAGQVPQNLYGIDYAILGRIKPGMEVLAASKRTSILDVLDAHHLRLAQALPGTMGKDVDYTIVKQGALPNSRRIVDLDVIGTGGFPESLIGQTIELLFERTYQSVVLGVADPDGDSINEALDIQMDLRLGRRTLAYRIRSEMGGTTQRVYVDEDLSTVAAADRLTLWTMDGVFEVSSTSVGDGYVDLTATLSSGLSGYSYVFMRGGAESYGRYVLYENANSTVDLDEDTSNLRLHVAEVLIDFGADVEALVDGTNGVVVEDGDDDGQSPLFEDLLVDFEAAGAQFGDRLTIHTTDGHAVRTFVTAVLSTTRIQVDPELKQDPLVDHWELERNSVSYALAEAYRLQTQLEALLAVVEAYSVPANADVESIFGLLQERGMDRAMELLYEGKFSDFASLSSTSASYSSNAKASIQTVGQSTSPTASTQANVNGPGTASQSTALSDSGTILQTDVATFVALSSGVEYLAASELSDTVSQYTMDELRNRAIYEMTGEIESAVVTDTDPTLPWLAKTGSQMQRLETRANDMLEAIDYIRNNPEEFEENE